METLFLSRLQFALTVAFHYIFPPLSIGLGVILAVMSVMIILTIRGPYEQRVPFWQPGAWLRPVLALVIMGLYAVAFDELGAVFSVVLLVAAWLLFLEKKRVVVAVGTGLLTGLVIHVVFERLLMTPFPRGFLF